MVALYLLFYFTIDTRPCHEHGDTIRGFLGIIDVVHQVAQPIDDDQTVATALAQSVVYQAQLEPWGYSRSSTKVMRSVSWSMGIPDSFQNTLQHIVAVLATLLRVEVEYLAFALRKTLTFSRTFAPWIYLLSASCNGFLYH